eukprot:1158220-Pelagomonas_calceolata.AAC.7
MRARVWAGGGEEAKVNQIKKAACGLASFLWVPSTTYISPVAQFLPRYSAALLLMAVLRMHMDREFKEEQFSAAPFLSGLGHWKGGLGVRNGSRGLDGDHPKILHLTSTAFFSDPPVSTDISFKPSCPEAGKICIEVPFLVFASCIGVALPSLQANGQGKQDIAP